MAMCDAEYISEHPTIMRRVVFAFSFAVSGDAFEIASFGPKTDLTELSLLEGFLARERVVQAPRRPS